MNEQLTIRAVTARPVQVPLARAHESAGGSVGSSPLVLIALLTEEGIAGASYLFCFAPSHWCRRHI